MTSLLNKQQQQQQQQQAWAQQQQQSYQQQQKKESDVEGEGEGEGEGENEDEEGTSSATPVRKRTRATADQLSVLEDTFAVNVSPNSKLRKQLAEQLQMSERSIQIWFQNRRAKVKHVQKRAQMQMHQASIRAQLYQYHQLQQNQFGSPGAAPPALLPQQSYQQQPNAAYYYNTAAARLAASANNNIRAQSVDAIVSQQHYNNNNPHMRQQGQQHLFTPASSVPPQTYNATPPPMSFPQYYGHHQQQHWVQTHPQSSLNDDTNMPSLLSRQSMPPQVYPYDFGHTVMDPNAVGSLDFPEYLHGQVSPSQSPLHSSMQNPTMPTLVSVPDAGPTAVLATVNSKNTSSSIDSYSQQHPSSSPESNTLHPSTINPSTLFMNLEEREKQSAVENDNENNSTNTFTNNNEAIATLGRTNVGDDDDEEPKDLYISATTLTIGTWHRLKMHETDLVCVYRPDTKTFAWHIVDGGCHFKMEVTQDAVSSIEFILDENEALADVHFDISEPPLFYMESTTTAQAAAQAAAQATVITATATTNTSAITAGRGSRHNSISTTVSEDTTATNTTTNGKKKKRAKEDKEKEQPQPVKAAATTTTVESAVPSPIWVQCSDFTEGKQASRFFRHTLKGIAHHIKQELLTLISNHEETRRLVHFVEHPAAIAANSLMHANLIPSMTHPHHPQHHLYQTAVGMHDPAHQHMLLQQQQQAAAGLFSIPSANPTMYWGTNNNNINTISDSNGNVVPAMPCELYMS